MHCRAAPALFFSIWALILKYWFWRLLYCPAWPRTIQGCYSHCDINVWGNSHVKYLDPCIQQGGARLKTKRGSRDSWSFYNSGKNYYFFFFQTCQSKFALFSHFTWILLAWIFMIGLLCSPLTPPSCKHCKIGTWGHETFQTPAFLQSGGGRTCRLPSTAALRFGFIALHTLAGKALACIKWLGQECTDRLAQ